MKKVHKRHPFWLRMFALLLITLLLAIYIIPVCNSCNDTVDVSKNKFETETIIETTATETEPEWQLIELPESPEYPTSDSFVTIYDVSDAISVCNTFICSTKLLLKDLKVDHPQYSDVQELIHIANERKLEYTRILSNHWYNREQVRPVMTEIWNYLTTEGGFTPEVTAGILGNICAESGGRGYEDINVHVWDAETGLSFYGICQWSVRYNPDVANTDLHFQLDYLINSYDHAFTYWGYNYSDRYGSKFRTEQFLTLDDPYEAAIAFAVCYERCGSAYVEHRGPLADKVYTYFTVLDSWPWPGPEPTIN